ncbi:hypothetical protein ACU686_09800 [Yinghuangia aomiensis]
MPHATPLSDESSLDAPAAPAPLPEYAQLPTHEQRQLLLALARAHAARLDTAQLLDALCDLADIITPFSSAPSGATRAPHDHRPPVRASGGAGCTSTSPLGDPAAQPFTLSVLRNPPRFRSGSPAHPQLLITSFPVDVPTAVSTYHRLGDKIQILFEHWGYSPGVRATARSNTDRSTRR